MDEKEEYDATRPSVGLREARNRWWEMHQRLEEERLGMRARRRQDITDMAVVSAAETPRRFIGHLSASRLFRYLRVEVFGLGTTDTVNGPLASIVTERRLRRCEKGEAAVPPRAWEAYAALLAKAHRYDLVKVIAHFSPEVAHDIAARINAQSRSA